jgi:hypothetical protein
MVDNDARWGYIEQGIRDITIITEKEIVDRYYKDFCDGIPKETAKKMTPEIFIDYWAVNNWAWRILDDDEPIERHTKGS